MRLKLVPEQERFVSHPIRSLAQAFDESQQGRGFGSAALDRVLDYIKTKPFESVSYLPRPEMDSVC